MKIFNPLVLGMIVALAGAVCSLTIGQARGLFAQTRTTAATGDGNSKVEPAVLQSKSKKESRPRAAALTEVVLVAGEITEWTQDTHGEIDGWTNSKGDIVHFPPHFGTEISNWLAIGHDVAVYGERKERLGKDVVVEAMVISHGARARAIPKPPHDLKSNEFAKAQHTTPTNISGSVSDWHKNGHGAIDGLILDGGLLVKFPKHLANDVTGKVSIGDIVIVDGQHHEKKSGHRECKAEKLTIGELTIYFR